MQLTNETFAPLEVMIDEFVRAGVAHAVISPGSRNAPIAYALGDREELTSWSVLDERQAGFFALGIAKSTGNAVIVTCTSGTAAANLHPAVIEADHAGVPLIVLTADRPPEMRDNGAGQTIDQIKLYGGSVRLFVEGDGHGVSDQTLRHFRQLAARAFDAATGRNPGPAHINLPLREPLRPVPQELDDVASAPGATGRAGGARWSTSTRGSTVNDSLAATLGSATRPMLIVGEQNVQGLAAEVAQLGALAGAPILADSLSQLRRAELARTATLVSSYDLILRSDLARAQLAPDLIVRLGELPTSKPLRQWLSATQARQIVIDPRDRQLDATRSATEHWAVDPLASVRQAVLDARSMQPSTTWIAAWAQIERAAQSAIDAALASEPFPSEPGVCRAILKDLEAATVWVSSSMAIRDVEGFGPVGGDAVRFLSNRGTNGIDGVLSSACGAIAPWKCDRLLLFTGDLALLYDASAMAIAVEHDLPLTIVCCDNNGGGIFSFLPLAEHDRHFERLVATPSPIDIEKLVNAYGMPYTSVTDEAALLSAVEEPGFVHVRTDRAQNKAAHDRIAQLVLASVDAELADIGAFR